MAHGLTVVKLVGFWESLNFYKYSQMIYLSLLPFASNIIEKPNLTTLDVMPVHALLGPYFMTAVNVQHQRQWYSSH